MNANDADIESVYGRVPRSDPFVFYCKSKSIKKISQLTEYDVYSVETLKGIGSNTAKSIQRIFRDYKCATEAAFVKENGGAGFIRLEDVFEGHSRWHVFVQHCHDNGIHCLADLAGFPFEDIKIPGIGDATMKHLRSAYLSALRECGASQVQVDISQLPDINKRMPVGCLARLGLSGELICRLRDSGVADIGDLDGVSLEFYDFAVMERSLKDLCMPVTSIFRNQLDGVKSLWRDCLVRRCQGQTLQTIAEEMNLTRERIRQITIRTADNLRDAAELVAACVMGEERSVFERWELDEAFDDAEIASCCVFVLAGSERYEYLDFCDKYVVRPSNGASLNEALHTLVREHIGDGMNLYERWEELEDILEASGFSGLEADDVACYLLSNGYSAYGEYMAKGSQPYGKICRDAIRKYFPGGIRLNSDPDNEDMRRLRVIVRKHYGNLPLPELNRALASRLSTFLVLSDRGHYRAIEQCDCDLRLFAEVYNYILGSDQASFYYREIFDIFRERFQAEGKISNSWYLHGMLKYLYPDDFRYERDMLVKQGGGRRSAEDRICTFIRGSKEPVTKSDIKSVLPGATDVMIALACSRSEDIIQWEYNVYNCVTNISLDVGTISALGGFLKDETAKNGGYLSERLFYEAAATLSEQLRRSGIMNAHNLFYAASVYFKDEYRFMRPHIMTAEFPVESPSVTNIAKALLYYDGRVSYSDYIQLAERMMWAEGTKHAVFAELERGCVRISRDDYIDEVFFNLSERVIRTFSDNLRELTEPDGYFSLSRMTDFFGFPDCGYEWNSFLAASLVERYETGFIILAPQVRDRRCLKGIVVPENCLASSYDDFVANLLTDEGIDEMSAVELTRYLKDRGLIISVIPQDIYESPRFQLNGNVFRVIGKKAGDRARAVSRV